ncbi:MAG: WbqC family protein [Bacteroidia bacterium]|nr:WbqC family protein [Bacteroidia bacterium]MDW8346856.1 WbqC family protein [Bacteroidia bacterium]
MPQSSQFSENYEIKKEIILPLYYFPNLWWWHNYIQADVVYLTCSEKYIKQTFRNRACIKNPQGRLNLTVPVAHYAQNEPYITICCSNQVWRMHHYKSIYHNYRKSAFFEYYQESLKVFFDTLDTNLIWEIAWLSIQWMLDKIKITPKHVWIHQVERNSFYFMECMPSQQGSYQVRPYFQLFGDFIHNLSGLDALFCAGRTYFNQIILMTENENAG